MGLYFNLIYNNMFSSKKILFSNKLPAIVNTTTTTTIAPMPNVLTITQHPQDTTAADGEASFSVTATVSDGSQLSYQWEKETLVNNGAIWTQQPPSWGLEGAEWSSVTYGSGTFVAVVAGPAREASYAATSPDGITWTRRALPVSSAWVSVTHGNDTFVAISAGLAATSPDGVTWTLHQLPRGPSDLFLRVTYGDGIFVAVAGTSCHEFLRQLEADQLIVPDSSVSKPLAPAVAESAETPVPQISDCGDNHTTTAASSPDGLTWTQRTMPVPEFWIDVAYGNGTFVAVSFRSNVAATSHDGINWTQRTLPVSTRWCSIAYGDGTFVAVAAESNIVATSVDGVDWTLGIMPATRNWYSVTYCNGVFVALALDSNIAATSPNGINWTVRTLPVSDKWKSAAYGNGTIVAVASHYGKSSTVATSTSGALQFFPLSGETASTLNLTGLTTADDGVRYRVVVDSPSVEPITSNSATLTVT
jgi:hypothetical protein